MKILGIDPGLANCGAALIDSETSAAIAAGFFGTSKGDETGDMQRRSEEQLDALAPLVRRADLVVVEWFTGGFGDNARATALTAVSAAGIRGLAKGLGKPTLTPAPVSWRHALGFPPGQDTELYAWLARIYPRTAARFNATKRPHVFDGLALAIYGRMTATNLHTSTRSNAA